MNYKIFTPIGIIAIAFSLFHLYTSGYELLPSLQQRSVHLGFALALVFLIFPYRKVESSGRFERGRVAWAVDISCAVLSFCLGYYLFDNYLSFSMINSAESTFMLMMGILALSLTLEATRRVLGLALPVVSLLSILYVAYGDRLPLIFSHSGFTADEIVANLGLSSSGILGGTLGISATYVVMFVMFGAFLEKSGAGQFIIDLAMALVGRFRGGPAKVSILASALFGSISGSPVANAVTTGVITIPLMKKDGYSPQYAASVEAVASTGGMLLPPVMGAASFMIADFLQIEYVDVLKAAIIPAILYFASVFIMVDIKSAKKDSEAISRDQVSAIKLIKEKGHLSLPLFLLIYLLAVENLSPIYAAFFAIVSVPVVGLLKRDTWMSISDVLEALQISSKNTLVVAIACACAGIVIGVINMTGIGLRFSGVLVELSGGIPILLLALTMISSIILGMGLPPVAAYIILAVLAAPALVNLGIDPLAAHLFIFYFGTLSSITPPMAVAVFATSAIAKSDPMKTGFTAVRLAMVAFIIPYMFVYGPALLLDATVWKVVMAFVSSLIGIFALAIALEGYFKRAVPFYMRCALFGAAMLLLNANWVTDIAGFLIICVFLVTEWSRLNLSIDTKKSNCY